MERNDYIEDELFPFYALDALTDDERAEVDAYVAANPAAAARLHEMLADAAELADLAAPLTPAPEVKAQLMARVAADAAPPVARAAEPPVAAPSPAPPTRRAPSARPGLNPRRFFLGRAVGFAAVLLLAVGGFGLWRLWQQSRDLQAQVAALQAQTTMLQSQALDLQTQLDQQRGLNTMLLDELSHRDEVLAQVGRPGAVTFAIGDPSGAHPAASGTVTSDPDSGALTLAVANLPPPETGTTYQAWLIVGGAPVSAGTFEVDAAGRGLHQIAATAGSFDAVGVSLEPAGGSDQPTADQIILLGPGA